MTKVLIVLSAADKWTRADGSIYESGVWAQEFVDLDEAFVKAGYQVDLASPGGVIPTMDKKSLDPKVVGDDIADQMRSYLASNAERIEQPWSSPISTPALTTRLWCLADMVQWRTCTRIQTWAVSSSRPTSGPR